MANRPALECLKAFNNNPNSLHMSSLVCIPVIYNVLKWEEARGTGYPRLLLDICKWIYQRGQDILGTLLTRFPPPIDSTIITSDTGWKTVWTFLYFKKNLY
jgi:hypothetical protein